MRHPNWEFGAAGRILALDFAQPSRLELSNGDDHAIFRPRLSKTLNIVSLCGLVCSLE